MAPKLIRTLLADDHRVFCDGMAQLLNEAAGFTTVKKFHNGLSLLNDFSNHEADLLLLDIEIPGLSGLEVLERIRLINSSLKIVILSMHEESIYSKRALEAGADGYMIKSIDSDLLIETLVSIANGNKYFTSKTTPGDSKPSLLSIQEVKILRLIADGMTSSQISLTLAISALTVKTHRQNMMRKLNVDNTAGLIRQAFAIGII